MRVASSADGKLDGKARGGQFCRVANFARRSFILSGFVAGALILLHPAFSADVQSNAQPKMLDGYLLKHYSWVAGDMDIAVTPQYIRISNPWRADVFVSKAPFKTVVAYDSAKKTFYETKPEAAGSFMVQRFLKLLGGDPHPKVWKKVEDGKIAGVKAGRYVVDQSKQKVKYSEENGEKVLSEMRVDGFWVAEDLNIPGGAADIVLKMEGFPLVHKMPLYMPIPKKETEKKPRVATYKVIKTKFPESKFLVPSGYRKEKAEYSLQAEELELFGGRDSLGLSKPKK